MLTLHTSSEEEKILYLREFAQNIRNNSKGPQLLEDVFYDKLWEHHPQVPSPPLGLFSYSLEETPLQPVLKSFITVFNIMRGYKINKSSVLGLAKSMYYITMLSQRWCLCGLVWFLPLPCSKIWNCAQDDIKF